MTLLRLITTRLVHAPFLFSGKDPWKTRAAAAQIKTSFQQFFYAIRSANLLQDKLGLECHKKNLERAIFIHATKLKTQDQKMLIKVLQILRKVKSDQFSEPLIEEVFRNLDHLLKKYYESELP